MLARISSVSLPRAQKALTSTHSIRHLFVITKAEHDKLVERAETSDAKYKLALADMENLRQRLNRQIEDTKQYAITGFCKDLLEVTDTFEMALKHITPEAVGQTNYDGISLIEQRIIAIFKKHGLISLNPKGLKFNPNEHQAMFECPDASKEPGTVSEVCKVGWKLHDRIVRPALVGVTKKPDS
jgi:molecular chaperone GrpE